ncbi:equilibrative nucleoside transporter 4-like isoform X2 [Acanthaster planci]|uniref:Equilibrative nucleoside transporter 4-like isoform X2 n=1 Tax=Acanthaster planci TaxID=133434 RepID=A0A8B7ZCE4_ACAPL|nr:equilibrative nucleoside transporter 4-like isoform X2 [Acanthaster planci]
MPPSSMSQLDDVFINSRDTAGLIAPDNMESRPFRHYDVRDDAASSTRRTDNSSDDSGSGDPMTASSIRVVHPRDRCNVIYASLLLAGIGFLLPYNSFITAVDYFLDKYPRSTIVFDMSLTYIVVAFVAVFLNNALVESFSLHVRVTFGYVVAFVALSLVAIFEVGLEVFSPGTGYFVILAAVAMVSLGCTVQQSSFYGYAGMLPRRFTQAVMTGESAAGLLTSLNRIITKLLVHDEKINTLTFFVMSAAMVLVCLLTHHLARRTDFVRYYMTACSRREESVEDQARWVNRYNQLSNENEASAEFTQEYLPSPTDGCNQSQTTHTNGRAPPRGFFGGLAMRREIARTLWPHMLSIGLAYFVTLCLFPGIESEVVSCDLRGWMPVILMAIFNATDFCGKIIGAIPYEWSTRKLVLAEALRLVIIPLMVLCVAPRNRPILSHEAWSMVFSGLLGITNGYFGSVPMIMAPARVSESKKELAGNIMTLSYNVGLTTGSATAYLLNYLLGSTPAVSCVSPAMANTSQAHIPG